MANLTVEEQTSPRPKLRRVTAWWWGIVDAVLFATAIFVLVEMAAPRFLVEGPSMEPTFYTGHRLIISRLTYLFGEVERGDIAVFNAPNAPPGSSPLVKRVIGLPGDTVEIRDTRVYVNGVLMDEPYIPEPCLPRSCPDDVWQLGTDEYFMLGDNRNHSNDSRAFDAVPFDHFIGLALARYFPFDQIGIIDKLNYPPTGP